MRALSLLALLLAGPAPGQAPPPAPVAASAPTTGAALVSTRAPGVTGTVLPTAPSAAPGRVPPAPPDPLALGRERYAEGDLAGTVAALTPWLESRRAPWGRSRTAGHLLLGMAHYGLENWNLASLHFYRVRRTDGPLASFGAWYEALVDHRRNRHTVAVRECTAYREKWPDGPNADDCLLLIGDAWAAHGNRYQSVQAYSEYLDAHPDSPRKEEIQLATALAYAGTRPTTGIALLHELALDHGYPSTDLAVTAELEKLAAAGHEGTAIPTDPNSKMRRAWSLRRAGKFEEAWDLFNDLAGIAESNEQVARWVADNEDRFAWLTRNYDVYATALAKDYEESASPDTAWKIFVAWSRAGEWAEAARWGRIGMDKHAGHWRWRSAKDDMAWATMLAGEYDDAAERWGALAKRGGTFGRKARFYQGLSLYRAGRFEEAVAAFSPLTTRSDWRPAAHYWRAKAHARLGLPVETENDRALARVHDKNGWYRLLLDNMPESERVVTPRPPDAEAASPAQTDGPPAQADAAMDQPEEPADAAGDSPPDGAATAPPEVAQDAPEDHDAPDEAQDDPTLADEEALAEEAALLGGTEPPPAPAASAGNPPPDERTLLERGTASWPERTGRWHGVPAVSPPSLVRPEPRLTVTTARFPATDAVVHHGGTTRHGLDAAPASGAAWASLTWETVQSKTASSEEPVASAGPPDLPLAGHVLPDGYLACRWYDRDTAAKDFLRFSEAHKGLWPKLPAAYDLAQAGLYTDAARVLFDIYEEWRVAVQAGSARSERQQQIAALNLRLTDWRPFLLLVRDHYHAARACWGLDKHALNEDERIAALRMGYPLVRPELVWREAQRYSVDPYLVYGIMRQESTYRNAALSPVGAIGLIQVMPSTGARVAAMLGEHRYSPGDLEEPTINLRYGIFYLSRLLDRFDGVFPLAVASYNGGPHNVSRWYKPWHSGKAGQEGIPLDVFVETIQYDETRDYVKRVSGHYARYIEIYEGDDTRVVLPPKPLGDDPQVIDF